jgi:hypothetical protein
MVAVMDYPLNTPASGLWGTAISRSISFALIFESLVHE